MPRTNRATASMVSAFASDAKSGKLTLLNQLPALGEDPCYLSFDKTGKYLFVANYTIGDVAVFPILARWPIGRTHRIVEGSGQHWVRTRDTRKRRTRTGLKLRRTTISFTSPTLGWIAC